MPNILNTYFLKNESIIFGIQMSIFQMIMLIVKKVPYPGYTAYIERVCTNSQDLEFINTKSNKY